MPDIPTTALVKTAPSPALARVSNQLALTDKLLTKPEEPFLIPYRKGGRWGFSDKAKNILIDCKYSRTWPFQEGLAKFSIGGERLNWGSFKNDAKYSPTYYGFFDAKGNQKLKPILRPGGGSSVGYVGPTYQRSQSGFAGGLAVCRPDHGDERNFKAGCVNKEGEFIISNQFPSIEVNTNGLALCYTGDRAYVPNVLYNNKGDLLLENVHSIGNVNHKQIRIRHKNHNDSYTYYIDQNGKKTIKENFVAGSNFYEGIALVEKDEKQFLIDELGHVIKQFNHLYVGSILSQGLVWAKQKNNIEDGFSVYTYYEDHILTPALKYSRPTYWHDLHKGNIIPVEIEDHKWIYLNSDGSKAFDKVFRQARPFNEDLAAVAVLSEKLHEIKVMAIPDNIFVKKEKLRSEYWHREPKEQWGFIDNKGKLVVKPKYSQVSDFVENVAFVKYSSDVFPNYEGYIDKQGNEYWE